MPKDELNIPQIQFQPEAQAQTPEVVGEQGAVQIPQVPKKDRRKLKKILLILGGVLLATLLILAIFVGIPVLNLYNKAQVLARDADSLKKAVDSQKITEIKKEVSKLKTDLTAFQGSFNGLAWTKVMPFIGPYWKDGEAGIKGGIYGIEAGQMLIETVEPYADIIGFGGGENAKSGEETANDRIDFVVKTIGEITPKVDAIAQKANQAKTEIDKINANRYPEEFRGKKIRENIKKVQDLVDEGTDLLSRSKPLLEAAPFMMGMDSPRTYLILFQNDKELRPTGGFITAYSIMKVNKGKLEPVSSNDIYNLDKRYTPVVPAPDPIIRYIKGPYTISKGYRLRDMNFDPDFKNSMSLFTQESKKAGISGIDGIIAVDTHVVVKILDVIGRIGVPGFGNFGTEIEPKCNCPQVIYELESFADVEGSIVWDQNDPTKIIFAPPNYENRKKIVGPLMNSVLRNALGQPKEKIPALFEAGWESITEKHVLFYMFDEKAQKAVEAFNIAGRMEEYEGDYLHISDANLGGRKSNLYATQEVDQEVKVVNGSVEKTVTITYKNPQGYDGWLNSVLPTWTRIYVPKGSQLISLDGFEEKADPYEENGKTVFAGGFKLRPQGVVKITAKYKLPFKVKGEYKLLVQKQPGTDKPLYTISVGKQKEELFLLGDHEFRFRI